LRKKIDLSRPITAKFYVDLLWHWKKTDYQKAFFPAKVDCLRNKTIASLPTKGSPFRIRHPIILLPSVIDRLIIQTSVDYISIFAEMAQWPTGISVLFIGSLADR
jgi:hypothetical protein